MPASIWFRPPLGLLGADDSLWGCSMNLTLRRPGRRAIAFAAVLLWCLPALADTPIGKLVHDVIPQGNRIRTRDDILSQLRTRPGQPYSQITAQDDVKRLYAKGWFTADGVRIETRIRPDNTVDVIVRVEELTGTVQKIEYRGAEHLGEDELAKLTGLRRGMPMSPVANRAATQAIL